MSIEGGSCLSILQMEIDLFLFGERKEEKRIEETKKRERNTIIYIYIYIYIFLS